jgi:hypothetical protein
VQRAAEQWIDAHVTELLTATALGQDLIERHDTAELARARRGALIETSCAYRGVRRRTPGR